MIGAGHGTVDGLDLPALERFFIDQVPGFRGGLTAEPVSGGRSNLTYRLTDGTGRWILRRPPLGGLTRPRRHHREYQVIAALFVSDVPVALTRRLRRPRGSRRAVRWWNDVDGRTILTQEQLHALPAADIQRCAYGLIDVLARLHAVDPGSVGLAGLGRAEAISPGRFAAGTISGTASAPASSAPVSSRA